MISIEQFKALSLENKRNFLEELLLQVIAQDGSQNGALEKLIFESTEEELITFFEATIDEEKRKQYVEGLKKDMENDSNQLIVLNNQMQKEVNTVKEYIETKKEGDIENILNKIN